MSLISLLMVVLILGLVVYLISLLPIGEPFASIVRVILVVIFIVWLLRQLGWLTGMGTFIIK